MIHATGALSVVQDYMDKARVDERLAASMLDNECWNSALFLKLEAEKHKSQAGIEFLLWMLARLNMADEPNPWQELQEKRNG